ncbi:hypothetical protein [Enterococcus asini]|uniref:hypothetical protein n=1 Tax=Enterococcus asini TaxID=57732 RepID=UPI00241F6EF2|nr:hypothetical protein [Enterococcus asini]
MEKEQIKETLEQFIAEDGTFDIDGATDAIFEIIEGLQKEEDPEAESKKKEAFDKVTEKYKK